MSFDHQLNGGTPRLRQKPTESRPPRLDRPFNEDDLRLQHDMLVYGCSWEQQYEVPPRPWSWKSEQECEEARTIVEAEDADLQRENRRF